jgi:hypothetical protein
MLIFILKEAQKKKQFLNFYKLLKRRKRVAARIIINAIGRYIKRKYRRFNMLHALEPWQVQIKK